MRHIFFFLFVSNTQWVFRGCSFMVVLTATGILPATNCSHPPPAHLAFPRGSELSAMEGMVELMGILYSFKMAEIFKKVIRLHHFEPLKTLKACNNSWTNQHLEGTKDIQYSPYKFCMVARKVWSSQFSLVQTTLLMLPFALEIN